MKNMKERLFSFFKMNRLIPVILCLFFATSIYAQNREVKGIVTGDDNEPMAGATIKIKNSQGGAIADIDGKFTMRVKTGDILEISFLGMKKQEIKVDSNDFYSIKLFPEANEFDEVTVVAFAKQKKESVISAISTVNPQELKVPSSNLTTALAGRMSGLIAFQTTGEPGKDNAQFFVRGATTFGYKKDPLILIDNIELSTDDLARLNVDDIAQFSIMKDATATALYGARGANGVILVTTKQGVAGKPKVSVRVEQSVSTPRKKVELTDPITFMRLNNEAVNSRRDPNNPAASANYTVYSQEKIENTIAGTNPYCYPAVNWYDELFNNYALSTRVNANLSGGGSAVRYYVAASYTKDGGVIKNDKLNNYNSNINWQRYSVRSNINMDLSKTTEFSIRVNGNFDDYTGPLDSGEGLYKKVMKTSPVMYPKSYPATGEYVNATHVLFGNADKGAYINPYADMVRGYKESNNLLVAAQAELKQKFDFVTKGLDARILVSTTRSSYSDLTRAINPYYYQADYDKETNSYTLTNIVEGEEYLSYNQGSRNINTTNYVEAAISYNRTFGVHATSGMLVYTRREEKRSSEDTLQKSLPRRNQGLAGRFTYAYDSRYFAEFNFGYTGSENFEKGKRFGFFPAVAMGWVVSNEAFMANTRSWLDNLKLRYSYGEVGNDRLAGDTRFPYISVVDGEGGYNFGEIGQTGVGGVAIKTIGTPNLTWETATKHNIGVDIGLFSKFTLTVDMFKDTRKNIFMKRDHIPGTVGLSGGQIPWANVGKMENMGFDGTMAYSDKIGDVSYTLRGNITYSNTNVIDYDEAANELNYKMTKGYRWSQTRGLIALGLFKDEADIENSPVHSFGPVKPGDIKYKDVNGDGVVNDDDVVPIGYTHNPGLIYGMGLSVEWKGFDFSVLFQGAGSCDFFVGGWGVYPFQEGEAGNIMKVASNPADRWISREISGTPDTENPNAIFPRLTYGNSQNNNRASTHWLRNGRYLRLKNLTIGYTIPKKISRKLLMEGARIYFLGNNLAVWDSFGWWDPELASDNGARYPIQKNFTLGLTLNF